MGRIEPQGKFRLFSDTPISMEFRTASKKPLYRIDRKPGVKFGDALVYAYDGKSSASRLVGEIAIQNTYFDNTYSMSDAYPASDGKDRLAFAAVQACYKSKSFRSAAEMEGLQESNGFRKSKYGRIQLSNITEIPR